MKKPFITLVFLSSLILLMFFGCEKNKASKNYEREMIPETTLFLKKDTFYIRLALTYSPEIIAKRVIAKGNVLDSVGYINEFNSLNSLRAYYYYQLQNRYNLYPAAIKNHVKKEHPSFFSVKIENITVPRSVIYHECPLGLVFNHNMLYCDWPENVEGGSPCYFLDTETGLYEPCTDVDEDVSGIDDDFSPPDCKIDNNLNLKVHEFVAKCCKQSITNARGWPGEYENYLMSAIKQNKNTT